MTDEIHCDTCGGPIPGGGEGCPEICPSCMRDEEASKPDPYDGADYYDCNDAESLTHETESEAIEYLLDSWATPDCDMVALIKEHSPITVTAYRRAEIPEAEWVARALHAAESILEGLDDEYGDPDGRHALSKDEMSLGAALDPVIRSWCKEHYQVWQCNPCGKREYSAEEVEAMMREENPGWFEKEEEA